MLKKTIFHDDKLKRIGVWEAGFIAGYVEMLTYDKSCYYIWLSEESINNICHWIKSGAVFSNAYPIMRWTIGNSFDNRRLRVIRVQLLTEDGLNEHNDKIGKFAQQEFDFSNIYPVGIKTHKIFSYKDEQFMSNATLYRYL